MSKHLPIFNSLLDVWKCDQTRSKKVVNKLLLHIQVVRISGFLQVMLCMYNSFVSLRKECLNGVVNMAAVCSVSKNTHAVGKLLLNEKLLLNGFGIQQLISRDTVPTVINTLYLFLFQPLHLDFCHQVTKFVRDCVLSSPVESLRSLSKVLCSGNNHNPSKVKSLNCEKISSKTVRGSL